MDVHVIGVDPGLVHTGAVQLKLNSINRTFSTSSAVFDGVSDDALQAVANWCNDREPQRVFVEDYRPRSHFSTDQAMGQAVTTLRRTIKNAVITNNSGVKKVVRRPLLELLGLWKFDQVTHHQDLLSAARIGVYGLLKEPSHNTVLANLVQDAINNKPWTFVQEED